MPRRTVRRESSVGLIVTLIFFILTSIGLGVATYYGFTQRDELDKNKSDALAAKKDADARADWYQFQALLFRTWLGLTDGMDKPSDPNDPKLTDDAQLVSFYGKFQTGQLGKDGKGTDLPDKQVVTDVIAKEQKKIFKIATEDKNKAVTIQNVTMGWNVDKMRPNINYEDAFKGMQTLADNYQKQATDNDKAKQEAVLAAANSEKLNQDDQAARKLEIAKLTKENQDARAKADDENADLRKQLVAKQADVDKAKLDGEKAVKDEHALVLAREQTINELKGRLGDLNERLALQQQKTVETPTEGKPIPTDWKIVRMDQSGKQPFINLGSAQNVRPGLTFSIHGQGPDGRPTPASKGTLEVLNVVGDNLSQAQIVSVKDSFKDPILPGDYLYNPIFHPGGEQHVVIAGPINMHGTKTDDLEEFERLLKRQNVVVDGYVDPVDGSIKGRMTVGTDFLVLGDVADVKEGSPASDSVKKLQEQARANGVRIVPAREFLESMGYRTP